MLKNYKLRASAFRNSEFNRSINFLTFSTKKAGKTYKCNRLIGFLEAVYQEALEIELKKAEIPYESGNHQRYSLIHPCPSVVILKSELLPG
jgi:hypothetical protein